MRQTFRKAAALITGAWLAVCLAGCGGTPLGRRAIVKTVFIDWTGSQFQAGLLVPDIDISADPGQTTGASFYCGKAADVAGAVDDAESSQDRVPFYGQNQLLILGRGASEEKLDEVLDYFGTEQAGRPGMAVFVSELSMEQMQQLSQEPSFAGTVLQMEKELMEQPAVQPVMVYQLPTQPDGVQGCIPRISLTEEDTSVDALVLYAGGTPQTVWEGEEMQMAQLLAGRTGSLNCTQQADGRTVRFTVDSARVRRRVEPGKDGPCLHLVLTGTVRWLSAARADQQPDVSRDDVQRQLSGRISQTLADSLQSVVRDAWTQRGDGFRLGWWFAVWDTAWYRTALQDGSLYDPGRIRVEADIRVL